MAEKSIKEMSFEAALAELELIVRQIDSGQQDLATSVANFERGVLLKKHCEEKIESAKLKIEKITSQDSDKFQTTEISI